MQCPKCKAAQLRENNSIQGWGLFMKRELTIFCPICKFQNIKEFKMSKHDLEMQKIMIQSRPVEKIYKYIKENGTIKIDKEFEEEEEID